MSEHSKWQSNNLGGGVFITMSDSTPVFVAEALGATREVKVKRAAYIALACNAHEDLMTACEKAQSVYDFLILQTPTGSERDELTEQNILIIQAIAKGTE